MDGEENKVETPENTPATNEANNVPEKSEETFDYKAGYEELKNRLDKLENGEKQTTVKPVEGRRNSEEVDEDIDFDKYCHNHFDKKKKRS